MQPEPMFVDSTSPSARVQHAVRALQVAFVASFFVGAFNGALVSYRLLVAYSGSDDLAPQGVVAQLGLLLSVGRGLSYVAILATLYGLYRLTEAPAESRAPQSAWTALLCFVLGTAIDLGETLLLTRLLPDPSRYITALQVSSLVATLIDIAGFLFLLETLRRCEEAAGGRRVAELRPAFVAALILRYAVLWGSSLLTPFLMSSAPNSISAWLPFALRQMVSGATFGLLLWILEIVHRAAASPMATGAAPLDRAPAAEPTLAASGVRDMVVGGLFFLLGGGATALSYATVSESGGRYVIAYGAILVGLVQFFRGLMRFLSR